MARNLTPPTASVLSIQEEQYFNSPNSPSVLAFLMTQRFSVRFTMHYLTLVCKMQSRCSLCVLFMAVCELYLLHEWSRWLRRKQEWIAAGISFWFKHLRCILSSSTESFLYINMQAKHLPLFPNDLCFFSASHRKQRRQSPKRHLVVDDILAGLKTFIR